MDAQAGCQFSDGNADTACTKIIAAFNHVCNFRFAEHTLNFALSWRIPFLHFCAALFHTFFRMCFAGTRCTTDSVAAGCAAQQNNDIPGDRFPADNICLGRSPNDRSNFQPFGHIAGVIELLHLTSCQTDLIPIGRVTMRRAGCDFSGRQLTAEGIFHGNTRVAAARYTHRLIDIGTTGKRVTDRAA